MESVTRADRLLQRSPWAHACAAVSVLSLVVIFAHLVVPRLSSVALPYSGGAAVVLGVGATVAFGLRSRGSRIAMVLALGALLGLRTLSAMRPDLLLAGHGPASRVDAAVLAVLGVAALAMLWTAMRQNSFERPEPV